ncbi:hypothetical protein ACFRKE_37470, partial [Kitasatospora indigofera]|uniref:hypothetical protein n=1 Tax=Kitasatospora indigofera TaxID=67307 RepID=UPI0036783D19
MTFSHTAHRINFVGGASSCGLRSTQTGPAHGSAEPQPVAVAKPVAFAVIADPEPFTVRRRPLALVPAGPHR